MNPSGESAPAFRILPLWIVFTLLGVGLASSLAFRLIIVAQHLGPEWVRPLWYGAVLLNAAFFAYRYAVSRRRVRAIVHADLDRKLMAGIPLDASERAAAGAILHSTRISPERWNYLVIFLLSGAAIAADLWLSA